MRAPLMISAGRQALFAALVAVFLAAFPAMAQQAPDPFVMPPPTQRPPDQAPGQGPAQPGRPAQPNTPTVTMEMLSRQGFEVKAVSRASDRQPNFVVMLQRAGEVRTCLMRVIRDQGQQPRQESICF